MGTQSGRRGGIRLGAAVGAATGPWPTGQPDAVCLVHADLGFLTRGMKSMKKFMLAFVMLGALGIGNAPAGAQNCSPYQTSGPYYATPSWDQKLGYQRFICLTDWNNQ